MTRSSRLRLTPNLGIPIGTLAACVLVMVLGGCARQIVPRFEDSHQMFLERAVQTLDLGANMAAILPQGSSVSLVSLERPDTKDYPVLALIEDQMIRSLLDEGFVVLERDRDILHRLVAERPGEHLRLTYLPSDLVISSAGAAAGLSRSGGITDGYIGGRASVTEIAGAGRDTIMVFDTHLETADYMISYRVLECGIVYRKGTEKSKKREAMVGLHTRVQDTRSGKILHAENVRGFLEDEVDRQVLGDLESYRYSFYAHDLPLQRGTPRVKREVGKESQTRDARAVMLVLGMVAVGALFASQ